VASWQGNKTVWYILTDTSDATAASALGLNFSQKLQILGHWRAHRQL